MSHHQPTKTPVFRNDEGFSTIAVGSHELACQGVAEPLDHPHVYLVMNHEGYVVCPYCSTQYVYDKTLKEGQQKGLDQPKKISL